MALAGIPIPETQCIGDSLDTINNAFQALDTAVAAAAGAGVTKITAGTNISISPTGGTGDVTINAEGGATVTVQDTPPAGAQPGDLWFDSSSGVTSVYYDGTWVDVGGGDSGTSAGSVNGIVQCDGNGNFSAADIQTLINNYMEQPTQFAVFTANTASTIITNSPAILYGANSTGSNTATTATIRNGGAAAPIVLDLRNTIAAGGQADYPSYNFSLNRGINCPDGLSIAITNYNSPITVYYRLA